MMNFWDKKKKKENENICSTSQKIPNVKYKDVVVLRIAFEFDNSGAIEVKDRFIQLI